MKSISFSKSRLMAYRQCPKRLWLLVHRPELETTDAVANYRMGAGDEVGALARQLFDPAGAGVLITGDSLDEAEAHTREALADRKPVFEGVLRIPGAHALADILLPESEGWQMIEVKSAASVKNHYRDDLAIQYWLARQAGVPCYKVSLAHINSRWVYAGDGNYSGLFTLVDLTADIAQRAGEVPLWIDDATQVLARESAPAIATGAQCRTPFPCGFYEHCRRGEPSAQFPIEWLPGQLNRKLRQFVAQEGARDMRDLPDTLLNTLQRRVKDATVNDEVYFDKKATRELLAQYPGPAWFLDFETAQLVIPRWPGNRPYTQIPFQFSLHRAHDDGRMAHREFVDISGEDPARSFAEQLISACGTAGPVFVYNRAFEAGCVKALAKRFAHLAEALLAINQRMVDLLPIAKAHYYHPAQQGSWSIKKLLPAVVPALDYRQLEGIQDGAMAMQAYAEATAAGTSDARRDQLRRQLLEYCKLDTLAMVRIWQVFADRQQDH